MSKNEPREIVTLAYCPECEVLSVPADLDHTDDRARCQRCGMAISADDYYDYAELRVVDYD